MNNTLLKYLSKKELAFLDKSSRAYDALFGVFFEKRKQWDNSIMDEAAKIAEAKKLRAVIDEQMQPHKDAIFTLLSIARRRMALECIKNPQQLIIDLKEYLGAVTDNAYNAWVDMEKSDRVFQNNNTEDNMPSTHEELQEAIEELCFSIDDYYKVLFDRVTEDVQPFFYAFDVNTDEVIQLIFDRFIELLPQYKKATVKDLNEIDTYKTALGVFDDEESEEEHEDDKQRAIYRTQQEIDRLTAVIKELVSNQKTDKAYRTKAKAGDTAAVPPHLALPSTREYQESFAFDENNKAYIQPIIHTEGLQFRGGKMFLQGGLKAISEVELQNMKTKEGIEEIDIPLLMVFYTVIYKEFEKKLKSNETLSPVVTIYAPDMAASLGMARPHDKKDMHALIEKVQSFHNIIGICSAERAGGIGSQYPVLNYEGYDEEHNTISISSPYINYIIEKTFNISLRLAKDGKPLLKKSGEAATKVSHSYLVKTGIARRRDKAAAQLVMRIAVLIEQAGKGTPHIKAKTLIEDDAAIRKRYNQNKNKVRFLQRLFANTWKYLREDTELLAVYKDIQLPDENDPKNIPTPATLDKIIFEFPHNGKRKSRKPLVE